MKLQKSLLSILLMASPVSALAAEPSTAGLPTYEAQKLDAGVLSSVGSDSMGGLMEVWVNAYRKVQPGIQVQITSGGSAAAPAALIEGTADLGPMARPMKSAEIEG